MNEMSEMSENIETGLLVDSVTVKDSGEKSGVTVVLKGQKTVTHETATGYTLEDTADITLTLKFGSMKTAKKLGIAEFEDTKVISLRGRDESLSSFEIHPAMQQKMV